MKYLINQYAAWVLAIAILPGCTGINHSVYLNPSVNVEVVSAIKPNDHLKPVTEIHATTQDPFQWITTADPLGIPHIFNLPLNSTFQSNVTDYFHYRYPEEQDTSIAADSSVAIGVTLSTFTLSANLSGPNGPWIVDTRMEMKVHVAQKGHAFADKTIQSSSETTGILEYALKSAVDQSFSKAILLMDKYLSSLNL